MIRWFTKNGVAANLLALIVIVAGLFTANSIKLDLFPELDLDLINVRVTYPGAAPEEVESGVVELIEDRIQDLDGIKRIRSSAAESYGSILIEVARGYSSSELRDNIKVRVDAITNLPEEAEEPIIEEVIIRNDVISLALYGDADAAVLKEMAENIRDELNARENITQIELKGIADYEISINLEESALRRYGLTFIEVADAVRRTSVDIPGGSIKARGGEILLRTTGKSLRGSDFAAIPLLTTAEGGIVRLDDVATIDDGFVDTPLVSLFLSLIHI